MFQRRSKTYFIVDETLNDRIIWSAELDSVFLCCVSRISEDLCCLSIEDKHDGEFLFKRLFTHQGKITPEMIDLWKDEVTNTIDARYGLQHSHME